jgi:hypothetical protein
MAALHFPSKAAAMQLYRTGTAAQTGFPAQCPQPGVNRVTVCGMGRRDNHRCKSGLKLRCGGRPIRLIVQCRKRAARGSLQREYYSS